MLNELQSSVSKHNKNTENPGLQQMNNVSQKSDTLSIFLIFEDNFVLTWIRQSYRNVVLSSCQLCGLNSYEAHLCIFLAFPLVIYISRQVCIYYRKRSPWRKSFLSCMLIWTCCMQSAYLIWVAVTRWLSGIITSRFSPSETKSQNTAT